MRKLLSAVQLIFLFSLFLSCGGGGGIGGGTSQRVLTSLQITPGNASIAAGLTQKFTATGSFSDGSTRDMTTSVVWTSSPPSVVTINFSGNLGLAKAVAAGSATITATSGGISGNAPLTVTPAVLKTIVVAPGNTTIPLGLHQQFTATGTLTDGTTQDLTAIATWNSSNTNVLTISNLGAATTNAIGSSLVTAVSSGITGTTAAVVGPAQLVSLAISPATPKLSAGASQQFTATGSFTDGTSQDLTASATWKSSAALVAPAPVQGFTQSQLAGTATITAMMGSISSSTLLTATQSAAQSGIHIRKRANINPNPGTNSYSDVVGEKRTVNGVTKSYAYVASWHNTFGVQILDVTNPDAPTLLTTYAPAVISKNMQGVQVANGIGFFASDSNNGGIHIVDLSNPASPTLLTRLLPTQDGRVSDNVHSLTIDSTGKHLYIPGYPNDNTILVYDVSNPSAPALLTTFNGTDAFVHDLTVSGNRLFAAGWNGTSDIFDISNPQAPQLLGSFTSGLHTQDVSFSQDGKFVFCPHELSANGDVAIFDISNPGAVVQVADIQETVLGIQATSPSTSKLMGNFLYVAWYQAGLAVFDVSDPKNPIFVGNYDTWPGPSFGGVGGGDGDWGVWPFLGTDRVLVSDRTTGLYVLDTRAVSTDPAVFGLDFNPNPVVGGNQAIGTVFLVGLAPAGGFNVDVSSSNPNVSGQTVFIPAGNASTTFTQPTPPVGGTTNVTMTATDGAFTNSTVLRITP
jgi:hypothetical protein